MTKQRPHRSFFFILLPLLLLVLAGARPAAAQPASEKQSKVAASAFFSKGQKLVKQRQYVSAIEAFERAYSLHPHYFVHCTIAVCHENLNDMVRAAKHYRRCLKEGASKATMADRVTTSLKAVEAQITWIRILSPGGGGQIYLDGAAAGSAPARIQINPGRHVVEVRRSGVEPARTTIKTLGGEDRELTLSPGRTEALGLQPAPPDTGKTKQALPQYWFWGAAGITVALTITAVVLGVQTLGFGTDYDEDPTEESYNKFTDRRLLTNIFWAATAVAAGGTTALFFYTDFGGRPTDSPKDRAGVTFGLAWRGAF